MDLGSSSIREALERSTRVVHHDNGVTFDLLIDPELMAKAMQDRDSRTLEESHNQPTSFYDESYDPTCRDFGGIHPLFLPT